MDDRRLTDVTGERRFGAETADEVRDALERLNRSTLSRLDEAASAIDE